MNLDLKVDIYNNMLRTSNELVNNLSDIDWYSDPKTIEKLIIKRDINSSVSYLGGVFSELKRLDETLKAAEWNEKLYDLLRIFKRFLCKNRKDASEVSECVENLEYITMLEM